MAEETPTDQTSVDEIVERLSTRFPEQQTDVIRRVVAETYAEFDDAPVRDFVAVLVEKKAKKTLKRLAD